MNFLIKIFQYHTHIIDSAENYIRFDFDKLGFGVGRSSSFRLVKIVGKNPVYFWTNVYKRFPLPYSIGKFLAVHFGYVKRDYSRDNRRVYVRFDGSVLNPYEHFTIVIGNVFFGGNSPEWLKAKIIRQHDAEIEDMILSMERLPELNDLYRLSE